MKSVLNTYNRRNIQFVRGKGSYLYSSNGKKYLDFVQGIAVNSLGHCHPNLVKAINKQSKKLWHVSNVFKIQEQEKLATRLTKATFADFVAFQNSGAEATELAIKIARKYHYAKGQKNKNRILCIKNSFHGRTMATLSATSSRKAQKGFEPQYGARPIKRLVQKEILNGLSKELLKGSIQKGDDVLIDSFDENIVFRTNEKKQHKENVED